MGKPVKLSSMRSAASMLCGGDSENVRALQTTRRNRTEELRNISPGALLLTRLSDGFESLSRELSEDSDFFRVFPETASKTSSFHEHEHPYGGHSSLLGFAYSKISQDLSSNRGACDVITQPYRWRELGISAEEKHSRPVQGARGTFGAVFIPCIG